jgi:hypothetical protein
LGEGREEGRGKREEFKRFSSFGFEPVIMYYTTTF